MRLLAPVSAVAAQGYCIKRACHSFGDGTKVARHVGMGNDMGRDLAPGELMRTTPGPRKPSPETQYALLLAICARAGLDLRGIAPSILARMRLLATTTETVRDCERCTAIAEAFFRHDDATRSPRQRFSPLERQSVVIGTLFSDIGKTGPDDADAQGQRLIAEIYGVEDVADDCMSVSHFFDMYFATDARDRVRRFRALGLDPKMRMRAFWNLHSLWTLRILRGDGVPTGAVVAAAAHHLLENINPLPEITDDERLKTYFEQGAFFARPEKLVVLLDKYDALRRRAKRSHDDAIASLRSLVENHPRFRDDGEFLALIERLDTVIRQCPI